jgi:predicted transcriptional regulator
MSEKKNTENFVKVRDVMSKNVEVIEGLETVETAIQHMRDRRFGALIVARRDESDEYGLLTVQDIARQVIEPNLSPKRVSVYEIMQKPVLTVHGDMNIRYAIRLMERVGQLRCLVTDNNEAVGVVTMLDMVMQYLDEK